MTKIKICEGLYISDCGRLFNDTKELSLYEDKDGYLAYRNDKLISAMIHRCVYHYFKGAIPEGMQIDHIDRNKKNNNIENLRIVSCSSNCLNKETYRTVLVHNMITKKTYITDNIRDFSSKNKLENQNLYAVLNKKAKQYRNWICKQIEYNSSDINFIIEVPHDKYDLSDIMTNINNRFVTVVATDTSSGKKYMFSDKAAFSKKFNLNRDCILKCLSKKYIQTQGFTFEYDYNIEIIGSDITEIS